MNSGVNSLLSAVECGWFILEGLVKRYPDNDRIHYLLGTYKLIDPVFDVNGSIKAAPLTQTNVDEALIHIKTAVELSPNNLSYKFSYALALAEIGRDKEAVPVFGRLYADEKVRADPKFRYGVINYANTLVRLKMREKALDEYRKSLAATNNDKKIAEQYMQLL
jgi:tetratricopeptide (TPR) repeat protein